MQIISQTHSKNSVTSWMFAAIVTLGILFQFQFAHARGVPDSFADIVERISPAVVNITTTSTVETPNGMPNMPNFPEGSPLEDLFRDLMPPSEDQGARPRKSYSLGSGFFISEDGYLVTNNHVIDKADEVLVETKDGREFVAKLMGRDPKTDIALLKVESKEALSFVKFGDSDIARVGDWVMAIGNPLGQGFSVSAGIISARNRELEGNYDDFIQTDAAINRGNSGGPLFNMDGEVIGVNTAILSPSGGSVGIGFAMSSTVVSNVVDQLKEFGETRRGWLGVRIGDVTKDIAEAMGLEDATGALVTSVLPGPSEDAGMKQGDVITSFDGKAVEDSGALVRLVGKTEVGKTVRVIVNRKGATETLKVDLGRREDSENTAIATKDGETAPTGETEMFHGLALSSITPDLRERFKLDKGTEGVLVTEVDDESNAFEKGIRPGDVLIEVNQSAVANVGDVMAHVTEAKNAGRKSVLLLVERDGEPLFLALNIEE